MFSDDSCAVYAVEELDFEKLNWLANDQVYLIVT